MVPAPTPCRIAPSLSGSKCPDHVRRLVSGLCQRAIHRRARKVHAQRCATPSAHVRSSSNFHRLTRRATSFSRFVSTWSLGCSSSGSTADSGGMHQAPLLGLRSQIEAIQAQEVTGRILSVITSVFVALFLLIAAAGAFWIWILDRPQTTYLWLTLGSRPAGCVLFQRSLLLSFPTTFTQARRQYLGTDIRFSRSPVLDILLATMVRATARALVRASDRLLCGGNYRGRDIRQMVGACPGVYHPVHTGVQCCV